MNRFLVAAFSIACLMTLFTILLSSFTHLPLITAMYSIMAVALLGLLLVALGYALALFEVRSERAHQLTTKSQND